MDSYNFAQTPSMSLLNFIIFFYQLSHKTRETNLKYVNLNQRRLITTFWDAVVSLPIYAFLLKNQNSIQISQLWQRQNINVYNKNLCFDALI